MRGSPAADQLDLPEATATAYPARNTESLIKWPSDLEIEEVSRRLAQIVQVGIRSEASGDYFNSGDLAYQIQEIIRSTAELCKKCNRAK